MPNGTARRNRLRVDPEPDREGGRGRAGHRFSERFLLGEWTDVVDAWQLRSWEAYRDVSRLGRKTRIGGRQRENLWTISSACGPASPKELVTRPTCSAG